MRNRGQEEKNQGNQNGTRGEEDGCRKRGIGGTDGGSRVRKRETGLEE